jgi:hypothetical protein
MSMGKPPNGLWIAEMAHGDAIDRERSSISLWEASSPRLSGYLAAAFRRRGGAVRHTAYYFAAQGAWESVAKKNLVRELLGR